MDGFDRIYDLHRVLQGRKTAISTQDIMAEMECSRATFNRIKRHMTDFLGAPIEYDRSQGGYRYSESAEGGFELPGLWLNEQELHALLLIQQLLSNLGVGLLQEAIYPIGNRVNQLLNQKSIMPDKVKSKIRFLGVAQRPVCSSQFAQLADATLNAKRLSIHYQARSNGQESVRDISPQRLINYRNNWYLDAWCHKRKHYRTFALECITQIKTSSSTYKLIEELELDLYFQASYGIFSGSEVEHAIVRFSPKIADRIASEEWHPLQKGAQLENGYYELELPVNIQQPEEFIMDILTLGEQAEVIAPTSLRENIKTTLRDTLSIYENA